MNSIWMVLQLLPVENSGMCTCSLPHQFVPMSAAHRPPGLRTSHLTCVLKENIWQEQDGAQENRGDITVLRWAVILLLAAPQHLQYKVHMSDRISVWFSTLAGTLDNDRKGIIDDFVIPGPACGPFRDGWYPWRIWPVYGDQFGWGGRFEISSAADVDQSDWQGYILKWWYAFLLDLITLNIHDVEINI